MDPVEATFLAQLTWQFVRMFVLMKCMMSSSVAHLGSYTRSIAQIKEIPCGRCRAHISCSFDFKIAPNICLDKTFYKFEFSSPGVMK